MNMTLWYNFLWLHTKLILFRKVIIYFGLIIAVYWLLGGLGTLCLRHVAYWLLGFWRLLSFIADWRTRFYFLLIKYILLVQNRVTEFRFDRGRCQIGLYAVLNQRHFEDLVHGWSP